MCNRNSKEAIENFDINVPEVSGSAREIIDKISREFAVNTKKLDYFKMYVKEGKNFRRGTPSSVDLNQ